MSRPRSIAESRTAPLTIETSPTVVDAQARDDVADECTCREPPPSITSTPPLPGSDSTDFSKALSSKHPHRGDRAGEFGLAAELAQLQVAAADVGADLVDQVSGGAGFDGHR